MTRLLAVAAAPLATTVPSANATDPTVAGDYCSYVAVEDLADQTHRTGEISGGPIEDAGGRAGDACDDPLELVVDRVVEAANDVLDMVDPPYSSVSP